MSSPAWLVAAIDQKLALLGEAIDTGSFPKTDFVMLMLTEPTDGMTPKQIKAWDKSCDNCGRIPKKGLLTGHVETVVREQKVVVTFGVCADCVGVDDGS